MSLCVYTDSRRTDLPLRWLWVAGRVDVNLTKAGNRSESSFELKQKEERAVRALGQHVSGEGKGLGWKISAVAIPWKRVALYATLAIGFFLLGFGPMWFQSTRAIEQRDAAQRGVRLAQLENTLSAAVIDVQRGQYEPARQLTSDFYIDLRRQLDTDNASIFTPSQREGLRSLLAERDELITLLARSDPAATDRLFNLYSTYNKLANTRVLG